jgi:hypothetical protein
MARKPDPVTAYVALTTVVYGPDQRQITKGDALPADDEAVRLFPEWFAPVGDEDAPTEDKLIAAQLETVESHSVPQPAPEPERSRPTGRVRALAPTHALLPADAEHDGVRSCYIAAGEELDEDDPRWPAVVQGPQWFEAVA